MIDWSWILSCTEQIFFEQPEKYAHIAFLVCYTDNVNFQSFAQILIICKQTFSNVVWQNNTKTVMFSCLIKSFLLQIISGKLYYHSQYSLVVDKISVVLYTLWMRKGLTKLITNIASRNHRWRHIDSNGFVLTWFTNLVTTNEIL